MKTLRSSWNSDRIAACNKVSTRRFYTPRKRYLFAQYRGKEVSVVGSRGKKHLTIQFDSEIVSAIIRDEKLYIGTMDQSTYIYNATSGVLVSEAHPTSHVEVKYGIAA